MRRVLQAFLACAVLPPTVALAAPRAAGAQESPCEPNETIAACYTRLATLARGAAQERSGQVESASAAALVERLKGKSSGLDAAAGALTSALSDFLPRFAGAVTMANASDEDETAAIEFNLPLDLFGDPTSPGLRQNVKARALVRDPRVYEPLAQAIPEEERAARVDELGEGLRELDDIEIAIGWNLEGDRFGRDYRSYSELRSDLLRGVVDPIADPTDDLPVILERLSSNADRFVTAEANCRSTLETQPSNLLASCLTFEGRRAILEPLVRIAMEHGAFESRVAAALDSAGFFSFADLINNQPQLTLKASARVREDPAGPDEYTASARYEIGRANVNSYREFCEREEMAPEAVRCLRAYTRNAGVRKALETGDRFFVEATYRRVDRYDFALPEDGVALDLPSTWEATGAVGFGRYLGVDAEGTETGRFDASAAFVYSDDRASRRNRLTATAAYTQRITPGTSAVLGLAYTSRPEFESAVDERFRVTAGLRYALARPGS